jgi:ferritin-like protein
MQQSGLPGPLGQAGQFLAAPASRRKFLRYAGISGLAATVLSGCVKTVSNFTQDGKGPTNSVTLPSGDIGILNFAYALEQLEAAFYTVVVADPYENIPSLELSRLTDIRDHEIAHREFFKTVLGTAAIQQLNFNFTTVDFSSRTSVLATAKTFEDIGVSAYNGAGSLLISPVYLGLAGKIVSVEARHAAYLRNLITPGSFADLTVVNNMGLDMNRTPAQVLTLAQPFITETIDGSALPTA